MGTYEAPDEHENCGIQTILTLSTDLTCLPGYNRGKIVLDSKRKRKYYF